MLTEIRTYKTQICFCTSLSFILFCFDLFCISLPEFARSIFVIHLCSVTNSSCQPILLPTVMHFSSGSGKLSCLHPCPVVVTSTPFNLPFFSLH